jgi:hypothetical protein
MKWNFLKISISVLFINHLAGTRLHVCMKHTLYVFRTALRLYKVLEPLVLFDWKQLHENHKRQREWPMFIYKVQRILRWYAKQWATGMSHLLLYIFIKPTEVSTSTFWLIFLPLSIPQVFIIRITSKHVFRRSDIRLLTILVDRHVSLHYISDLSEEDGNS